MTPSHGTRVTGHPLISPAQAWRQDANLESSREQPKREGDEKLADLRSRLGAALRGTVIGGRRNDRHLDDGRASSFLQSIWILERPGDPAKPHDARRRSMILGEAGLLLQGIGRTDPLSAVMSPRTAFARPQVGGRSKHRVPC